jgi:hypothetical protein
MDEMEWKGKGREREGKGGKGRERKGKDYG